MRRIKVAVGLAMSVDAALYLAVVPLLPHYADEFDLSRVEAGIIVACYPALVLITSVPAGALVGRYGGRRMMVIAGALFTASTLAFAFAVSQAMPHVQAMPDAAPWMALAPPSTSAVGANAKATVDAVNSRPAMTIMRRPP